jgi:hypothetical protein
MSHTKLPGKVVLIRCGLYKPHVNSSVLRSSKGGQLNSGFCRIFATELRPWTGPYLEEVVGLDHSSVVLSKQLDSAKPCMGLHVAAIGII